MPWASVRAPLQYLVRTRPLYRVPDDWEFAGMVNVPKSASWSETLTVSTTGVARSAAQAPAAGAAAGQVRAVAGCLRESAGHGVCQDVAGASLRVGHMVADHDT